MFPEKRMRRLRKTPVLRRMVAETNLGVNDFVAPLFVREGLTDPKPIKSLPGMVQHTVETLKKEVHELAQLGVPAIMLFGIPEYKDEIGSQAWNENGIMQVALRELRKQMGDDIVLIADLCLDEYTSHGHCGQLDADGDVDNDATLELYGKIAVSQAYAGAHMVGPSGMMDGQIAVIRGALDEEAYENIGIMAYSAKYASALFGPFREAVDVKIVGGGNRKTYQQDPSNAREAMAEIALDVEEGADIVMVKPAVTYLDIIAKARERFETPIAAYHVSGEYSMIKAAAQNGWIDGDQVALEQLTAIKRAGADMVLTYFAKEMAEAFSGA